MGNPRFFLRYHKHRSKISPYGQHGRKKAQLLPLGGRLAKSFWIESGAGERGEGEGGGSRKGGGGERCDDQVVRIEN